MINFYTKITFIGTIIGITILLLSIVRLKNISKNLGNVKDDEYYIKFNRVVKKYLILGILGISITTIMQLLRIFLR